LERALPDLRLVAAHFRVLSCQGNGGGSVVSFVSRAEGTFDGELRLGEIALRGDGGMVRG